MSGTVITHNADQQRYDAHHHGELAGYAEYLLSEGLVTFTHTEVDPRFEGRGIGSALVRGALDHVREQGGRKVLPVCPFVKDWMARHADYQDLGYRRN